MNRGELLALAREDWAHVLPQPACALLSADHLIALAVGCVRQHNWPTSGLTAEDAKILQRRAPLCAIGTEGRYLSFSNDLPTLRYLLYLNS